MRHESRFEPAELPENTNILQKVREIVGRDGNCLDMAIAKAAGIEKFIEIRALVSKAGHFGEMSIARWYNKHTIDEALAVVDRAVIDSIVAPPANNTIGSKPAEPLLLQVARSALYAS